MIINYADTSQVSKIVKPIVFRLPTFGESRTDPTYYEPTATRIGNMRKSASVGVALYDYEGDFSKAEIKNQTRKHFLEPAREIGITREELSQIQNEAAQRVDSEIKAQNDEAKDLIDEKRRVADMAKAARDALNDSSSSGE